MEAILNSHDDLDFFIEEIETVTLSQDSNTAEKC